MPSKLPKISSQKGQGFIEVIIALAILLMLFHAFSSLLVAAYDLLGNSRTRVTARHLAVSRMEEIRNLDYDSLGVVGGIPPGVLSQEETLNRNGLDYTLKTSVIFIDDPFDNLAPSDSDPADYKRARVDISWTGRFVAGESVTMISDIAKEAATGGGLLSILVFDADAQPVPQAEVHIVNSSVSPQIDVSLQTNDEGRVSLPGAPACSTCYQISVTKEGYSTDRNFSSSEVANPSKPYASVTEGLITETSFSIDLTSNMKLSSTSDRESGFTALASQDFRLRGGKVIGTDSLGDPVYKFDQSLQTDSQGSLVLEDIEWDSYQLTIEEDTRDLAGTNPLRPILLFPDATLDVLFASASHADHSLLLSVADASGSAIASASAQLTGPGGYDETIFTGDSNDPDYGQAFFTPLQSGDYNLSVSKSGYQPNSAAISVEGKSEYLIHLNQI